MYEIDLSLKEILTTATINNAKAFGLEEKYRTIEKRKIAYLVILDKNQLQEIEAYNTISKVIIRGEIIERKSLLAN